MTERIDKVNSLMREELAKLLHEEIEVPKGTLVTVVSVETSVDLYYATAFVSVIPKEKEEDVLNQLQMRIKEIQKALNRRLVMKYVPQLRFKLDHSEEKQAHMEDIIDREAHEKNDDAK